METLQLILDALRRDAKCAMLAGEVTRYMRVLRTIDRLRNAMNAAGTPSWGDPVLLRTT